MHKDDIIYAWEKRNGTQYAFQKACLSKTKRAQEDNRSVNGEIVLIVHTYLEEQKGKRRRVTLQKDQA